MLGYFLFKLFFMCDNSSMRGITMNKKIAFIGTASCGKSTLATNVFSALKEQNINAELVDEFIRRDIQLHGPMETIWEQYRTRIKQKEYEDAIPDCVDYTLVDSGTLTPYFYACLYAKYENPRERIVLQDMYKWLLDDLYLKRYHMIFYVPLIAQNNSVDGTRYQNNDQIKIIDENMYNFFMKQHRVNNIFYVDGSFDNRKKIVLEKII